MSRLLLALFVLAAFIGAIAPAPAASLRTNVVVEGDTISLGDIFEDAGPKADAPILYSPAPGRHIILNAAWLGQVARMFQVAWRPSNQYERVVVERAGKTITTTDILPPLRRQLRAAGMPEHAEIALSNRTIEINLALDVPPTIDVRNVSFDRTSGQFTALLVAGGDGPNAQRLTAVGRTYPASAIPVLRRELSPGEIIRQDDVDTVYRRDDLIGRDIVTEAKQIVGRTPFYRIRVGEPIRQSDTRAPLLVSRNTHIVIKLEYGAMTLTVQGKALDDGARGEVVRVENLQSNKTIEGTVTAPDTVSISIGPRLAASN
ncbi:MAG TPA: flagellar basal body P-ring formation chaperone FlgA [Alphaproteobacteria bacterium]